MAHELTHVQNRDVIVMTIASFFATIASYIVQFGFFFGGGGDDDDSAGFFALILVSLVVYAVSFFLLQALSRYREFSADRGAGIITGPPERARLGAAEDLAGRWSASPSRTSAASAELAAFYIFPPSVKSASASIFSTHPPLEKRLAKLEELESQLQGTIARRLASGRRVGLFDVLRGKRELKKPASDRLFAMATAYVQLEGSLGLKTTARRRSSSSSSRPPTSRRWPRTCRSSSARRPRRRARRWRRRPTPSATAG